MQQTLLEHNIHTIYQARVRLLRGQVSFRERIFEGQKLKICTCFPIMLNSTGVNILYVANHELIVILIEITWSHWNVDYFKIHILISL